MRLVACELRVSEPQSGKVCADEMQWWAWQDQELQRIMAAAQASTEARNEIWHPRDPTEQEWDAACHFAHYEVQMAELGVHIHGIPDANGPPQWDIYFNQGGRGGPPDGPHEPHGPAAAAAAAAAGRIGNRAGGWGPGLAVGAAPAGGRARDETEEDNVEDGDVPQRPRGDSTDYDAEFDNDDDLYD